MRAPALLLVPLAVAALVGCGTADGTTEGGRLQVAVGLYPYQYVAARVGGPDVEVTSLTEPGAEPHDLELTPRQVAGLADTDLVVYSAGFQPALDEAVEQQAEDRALDVLGTVEVQPGTGEDAGGADPHVWLDPVRLATIADAVAERLAEASPEGADGFRSRAAELGTELEALDAELRSGLARCARTEVVTGHDAFGYLTGAYGLTQVPIAGLSPEDEASPGRLAELAELARERGVTTVFFEELTSPEVAESLAREVGARATVLDPLEGPPQDGDYVDGMRANLTALRTALDCA